tara:strand:- start:32 stop:652 length:621 start_codon:yes stop_codon:yes gene_type:complete
VISVLTYGNEIWNLTEKVKAKLRGWNARCLSVITGKGYREETVNTTFDLVARLRSRRLRWAGHILRLEEKSLLRRVLLAQVEAQLLAGAKPEGSLLADAQHFSSVEELLTQAQDRLSWSKVEQALLPAEQKQKHKPKTKPNRGKTLKQRPGLNNHQCSSLVNGKLRQVILPVSMFPPPPLSKGRYHFTNTNTNNHTTMSFNNTVIA